MSVNGRPDPPDWISLFQESKTWDNVLLKNSMKKTLIGVADMLPYRFYKNSRGLVVLAGTFTVIDAQIVTGSFLVNLM